MHKKNAKPIPFIQTQRNSHLAFQSICGLISDLLTFVFYLWLSASY